MKRATLFALIALAVVSAVRGQAFRAGDQVYLPALGHLVSASSTFASDIVITNLSNDAVSISVLFAPANTENPVIQRFPGVLTLTPRERRPIADFAQSTLGISGAGMAVFNGCKQGATCAGEGDPNYRLISVESRIYSFPSFTGVLNSPAPTVGQDLPAIPWRQLATADAACCAGLQQLEISGIRSSTNFRTNLGAVNASEFSSCYLTLTLIDGTDGGIRDQVNIHLGPLANFQRPALDWFPKLADWSRLNRGRSVTNAVVTITQGGITPTADAVANGCPAGCPAFLAYGSMLDNQTNDATTLEAQYVYELAPATLGAPTPSIFATLRASALSTMSAGDELRRRDRMSYEAGLSLHRDMQVQLPADCNLTVACLANLIAMRQAGITPPSASR